MKHLLALSLLLVAALGLGQQPVPKIEPPPIGLPRGARPTPFPKIVQALKLGTTSIHRATAAPAQVVTVPPRLSMWGNSQYGDCVSAESAFAIADYSVFLGINEIFVTESDIIAWARSHGFLNGADLLEVIQAMQKDGVRDEKATLRKAGQPSTVNFANEETLKSAIAQGPVSIAIDANALPSGAGNKSGWFAFGGRSYPNTDHCVCLHGYGPTSALFAALGVPVPSGAPANGYYLYTWNTVGVIDHAWLMNTCVEAWVRNPTTTDLGPAPPPPPPPGVVTVAVPNVTGAVNVPVKITPTASGGTSPYLFIFDYGDLTQDQSGTHTYKAANSYTVTVTAVDSKGNLGTGTCVASISMGPNPPPPGPTPGAGTISWTINGVTSQYELFPVGSRKQILDIIGPQSKGE